MLMLLLAVTLPLITQETPERHVRATEPSILALIDAGLSRSATFRDLIATLTGPMSSCMSGRNSRVQTWEATCRIESTRGGSPVSPDRDRYARIAKPARSAPCSRTAARCRSGADAGRSRRYEPLAGPRHTGRATPLCRSVLRDTESHRR